MHNFSLVKNYLDKPAKILLTSHYNPDGDALGSLLALYHFFKQAGHEVKAMVPSSYPDFLNWMPGQEDVLVFEKDQEKVIRAFENAEILFALDYNAPDRLGDSGAYFKQSKAIKILIDHHIAPEVEAFDYSFSQTDTSSTSELVYQFMKTLDAGLINKNIAECIYSGILTDTGSFSYNCNYQSTFTIVAELLKHGIDLNAINRLIYSNQREDRLRLLGFSLSQKLEVLSEFNTAFISLSKADLESFNYQVGDTEGLVNYALSIHGMKFAALFTERDEKIRISFRSAGDFSVNSFARKHFEGGGHKNAAGGDSFESMDKTLEKFKRLLIQYKNELV